MLSYPIKNFLSVENSIPDKAAVFKWAHVVLDISQTFDKIRHADLLHKFLWSKLIYTLSSNPHIQDFLVAVTEKQTFWVNLCFEMSIYFFADSKHTLNNLSTIYSQIGIMFWFICYQWPNQVLLKAAYRGNFFQT